MRVVTTGGPTTPLPFPTAMYNLLQAALEGQTARRTTTARDGVIWCLLVIPFLSSFNTSPTVHREGQHRLQITALSIRRSLSIMEEELNVQFLPTNQLIVAMCLLKPTEAHLAASVTELPERGLLLDNRSLPQVGVAATSTPVLPALE